MFRPRLTFLAAALCAVGVLSTAPTVAGGRPDLVEASMLAGREYIPNEMLVQFKAGTTPQMKQLVLARVGAEKKETVVAGSKRSDAGGDLDLVVLPPGAFVSQAMRGIGSDPFPSFLKFDKQKTGFGKNLLSENM